MAAIRLALVLWEVNVGDILDVRPNEVVQRVQVGGGGSRERRVQSCSTPSEAKPGSLWTCGPAPSPAATPRVCHRPPDCTRGSPHSSAHPGTLWCWLSSQLQRCEVAWSGPDLWPKTLFSSPWARPCYSWQSRFAFWGCWQWSCCHN